MKKRLILLILTIGLVGTVEAIEYYADSYSGIYFDANPGNTDSADGLPQGQWLDGDQTASTDLWMMRVGFGTNNNIFQANGSTSTVGDCPMLVTTVPNLIPDSPYDVYVTFISGGGNNWRVLAGFEADVNTMEVCTWENSTETGNDAGGRHGYEHFLGRTTSGSMGEINVYIEDWNNPPSADLRTWYDGIVYQIAQPYDPNISQSFNPSDVDVTLSWKAAPGLSSEVNPLVKKHYVYISGDLNVDPCSSLSYAGEVLETSYDDANASFGPVSLNYGGKYNWQIEEGIDNGAGGVYPAGDAGNILGPVWQFETYKRLPNIVSQPDDVVAKNSDSVQFTVDVVSPTAESYQWYRSSDAQVGGDTTVGTNSNTLAVTAGSSTEAWYYVVITNTDGSTTSNIIGLWLEKEAGHWRLNNNLTDSTGNGWTGVWDGSGTPVAGTFNTTAIEGSHSVDLPGSLDTYITVTNSEAYFSHYVAGLTASCWVKMDSSASNTMGVIAKQALSTTSPAQGWTVRANDDGTAAFIVRRASVEINSTNVIDDGQWHMVTGVYDPQGGNGRLYIDGLLAGIESNITPEDVNHTFDDLFMIGGEDSFPGSNPKAFDGMIDDVRLFTYPMTSTEVASLYLEHVPDATICIDSTNPDMDVTGDCRVTFEDLAMFVAGWLDCHLYPVSRCTEQE